MRVVMVTPDIMIDRRILLEAKSLVDSGKEVIIVANWGEGLPEYEIIDNIKIHRMKYSGIDPRLKWLYAMQHLMISLINITSGKVSRANNFISSMFNRVINKISNVTSMLFNFIIRAIVGIISILARVSNKLVTFTGLVGNKMISLWARSCSKSFYLLAVVINKITNITAKVFGKLSAASGYECYVMSSIEKYDADVYHAHDLPVLRPTVKSATKLKAKIVYDAHELYTEIGELPKSLRKQLEKIEKKYITKVNAVITVNEFIADEMADRYNIAAPYVLYNSTNKPATFDNRVKYDKFREKWPELGVKKIVLYQGWFSLYRNLTSLVESARFLNENICLVFMGYGDERKILENIVEQYKLHQKVYFLDAVSQDVLLQYSASADVGIIPYPPVDMNHYWCSPNKLFEFIQAGIPIIASDLPFLTKIIRGNEIGLTSKLDSPESFAEAINLFFEDDRSQLYRNNINKIVEEYSWSTDEKKLIEIYHKLI
ncbi:hypothetical protein PN4B1_22890 [Paenibacillus naphthalenovorans]|uniref:glycosyltransferase n=1 Tax=Paenibacillus naphthalenovorans TaxID=162209 RepID=UPI0010B27446|nr:glycosyltransferase [Paenibacillus naphthalenovorans]GCL72379.1 hypothetical protein PN4B1_22890 [Paenibacillus naphthalenovorans]